MMDSLPLLVVCEVNTEKDSWRSLNNLYPKSKPNTCLMVHPSFLFVCFAFSDETKLEFRQKSIHIKHTDSRSSAAS